MELVLLKETDSTNDFLLANADCYKGVDITVAVADFQTNGHGMGSNKWESEPGKNLLFSILVHPEWLPVAKQFLLSMATALALREVIAEAVDGAGGCGAEVKIKWPNDIYWKDKKMCGTRIDANLKGSSLKDMIIGTGVNVNQEVFVSDAPNPVSLKMVTGCCIDCMFMLDRIMTRFEYFYNMVKDEWERTGSAEVVITLYHEHLYRNSGMYRYEDAEGIFNARLLDVQPNGIMRLVDDSERIRQYEFKEVKFIH